jgi:hypothetical protein
MSQRKALNLWIRLGILSLIFPELWLLKVSSSEELIFMMFMSTFFVLFSMLPIKAGLLKSDLLPYFMIFLSLKHVGFHVKQINIPSMGMRLLVHV